MINKRKSGKRLRELERYARQCDMKEFMTLIGSFDARTGMNAFNLTAIIESLQRNHDHARQMTAFAAIGYVASPRSVRRPQAVTTGLYAALYMGLYKHHPEHPGFMDLLSNCVPDIYELVAEMANQAASTMKGQ